LLDVRDLHVEYRGAWSEGVVHAVAGVDLTVDPGRIVALVGESGSGKSSIVRALTGRSAANARITADHVTFAGSDLFQALHRARGPETLLGRRIAVVPQDPTVALDPTMRIGTQLREAYRGTAPFAPEQALSEVRIDDPGLRVRQYPFQLSGGQRQRVLIAMATVNEPELILADEPTSGLDVTVQKSILDELSRLASEKGVGIVLITHDLGVAFERADEVLVMSRGEVVDRGTPRSLQEAPRDPVTREFIRVAPSLAYARTGSETAPRALTGRTGYGSETPRTSSPSAAPTAHDGDAATPRLEVKGVSRTFDTSAGRSTGRLTAVDDVSLRIPAGTTLGIVGGSGSGKTTLARIIAGLETADSGELVHDGEPFIWDSSRRARDLRPKIQFVHQNPYASFDPRYTVGKIVAEGLRNQDRSGPRTRTARGREQLVCEALEDVGLAPELLHRRAELLSGGQRQRVAIARALVLRPETVVLDEPVSALDVTVQDQILQLLRRLQEEHGLTYLFISHDLAVIREISHNVAVLHHGRIVEHEPTHTLFSQPTDPYTRELLDAIPHVRAA
jgi:peptide/nickel transport system ATP-binding protein